MKIQTLRRSILLYSICFISFGVASIRVNQQAVAYAFLFDRLGMKLPQANAAHAK
ncbi:MAG TPA: hypothetical protein VE058_12335 [Steroidobacteraceae bacterium]|nr:hypothetical protein [Steroidobacteraceae bacterium]